MKVQADEAQKRFVITTPGAGVSCLGFDVAKRDSAYIADRLHRLDLAPTEYEYGTIAGYTKYIRAVREWGLSALSTDTWFTPGTPAKVQEVLERYRLDRKVLRVFYGDHDTGLDWKEENDVVGFIGRSTGTMRVPLLLRPRERGGASILTHCIVRLMDGRSGKELYRTPKYAAPQLTMRPVTDTKMLAKGLSSEVIDADGKVQARFPGVFRAAEYIEFITGAIPTMREDLEELAAA